MFQDLSYNYPYNEERFAESYVLVFNSNNGVGTDTRSLQYAFDWKLLAQGKYEIYFSYKGNYNNISSTASTLAQIIISPPISSKVFTATSSTGGQVSGFLGCVNPAQCQTTTFLSANVKDNAPIFIDSIPQNNQFTISIQNGSGVGWTDFASAVPNNYILTMYFHRVG